jgi:DNA-binding transcriptional LysR family regulator
MMTTPYKNLSHCSTRPGALQYSLAYHRLATQAGIPLQIAMEANHIEAKLHAVTDGVGIGPIGRHAAAPGIAAGQLTILQVEGFPIRIDYAVVHQKGGLSLAADLYRRHLLSYRAPL